MKKLMAVLLCLALAAGLLVSCGKQDAGSINGLTQSAGPDVPDRPENVDFTGLDPAATEYRLLSGTSIPGGTDLKEILCTARISGSPGSYTFSFDHPQVPEDMHLTVSLRIYSRGRAGDKVLFNYDSDGAWLADPKEYDPSERTIQVPLGISEDLDDKCILVSAKLFSGAGTAVTLLAKHDFDGSITEGSEGIFAWGRP